MGALENAVRSTLWHLVRRNGFSIPNSATEPVLLDTNGADPDDEDYSEVYRAYSETAKCEVAVKIKRNGSIEESETVSAIRLPTIPHYYTPKRIEVDGTPYVITPRKFIEGTVLSKTTLDAESARKVFIALAKDDIALEREGLVFKDSKPTNIIIDAQGKPYNIDTALERIVKDERGAYTKPIFESTEGFVHPAIKEHYAQPERNAFALLATIDWVARKNGFVTENLYTQLSKKLLGWLRNVHASHTTQEILDALEEPDKKRKLLEEVRAQEAQATDAKRKTRRRLLAVFAVIIGEELVRNATVAYQYNNSENDAVEKFDASLKSERKLAAKLSEKIASLVVDGTYAFYDGTVMVPYGFKEGKVLEAPINSFYGHGLIELLTAAAGISKDKTILAALRAHSSRLVSLIEQKKFVMSERTNLYAPGLLEVFNIDHDKRYLQALTTIASWLAADAPAGEVRRIQRWPGGTILPFDRPSLGLVQKPILDSGDVYGGHALLAGYDAALLLNQHNLADRLSNTLGDVCDSLSHLIQNGRVRHYASLETVRPMILEPTAAGPEKAAPYPDATIDQVELSRLLWNYGQRAHRPDLQVTARALLTPLLSGFCRVHFDQGEYDAHTSVVALELSKVMGVERSLTNNLESEIIHGKRTSFGLWGGVSLATVPTWTHYSWSIERKEKGLLLGITRPYPYQEENNELMKNISFTFADASLLRALRLTS